MTVKKWTSAAMLAALYVALAAFSLDLRFMKISFSGLAVVMGGLLMGPGVGALVGFVGALLEQLLRYGLGPTTLIWILPVAARGALVGILAKRYAYEMNARQTGIILVLSAIFLTLMNTLAIYIDSKVYGYYTFQGVFGMILARLGTGIVTALVYLVLVLVLLPRLRSFLSR